MSNRFSLDREATLYHVYNRGVNKQNIFLDDNDRQNFIWLCDEACKKYQCEIYAFCLMKNHYHLLLFTIKPNLSKIMKLIGEKYSKYFLARYKEQNKVGHTFQGPYGRKIIDSEEYLTTVLNYIHYNPRKDGFVSDLRGYFWSSYNQYLTGEKIFKFLNVEFCGKYFTRFDDGKVGYFDDFEPRLLFYGQDNISNSKKYIDMPSFDKVIKEYTQDLPTRKELLSYFLSEYGGFSSVQIAEYLSMKPDHVRKLKMRVKADFIANKFDGLKDLMNSMRV